MKKEPYPYPIIERSKSFGRIGEFLLKKLPSTLVLNLYNCNLTERFSMLQECSKNLDEMTMLALTVLVNDCGFSMQKFSKESFLFIMDECVKPLQLPVPLETYEKFYPNIQPKKLINFDYIIEIETKWQEMILSDFFNFDSIKINCEDCDYELCHWWHTECPSGCVMLYDKMPAVEKLEINTKDALLHALVCSHYAEQICNIWDGLVPVSNHVRFKCGTGCGGWYEMTQFRAAKHGRHLVDKLIESRNEWLKLICCENCKLPGCVGLFLCTSVLEAYKQYQTNPISENISGSKLFPSVCQMDPLLHDLFLNLCTYPNFNKYLDFIYVFGWSTSKLFDRDGYLVALRAKTDPEGYETFSRLLHVSGLSSTSIGSIMCDLHLLSHKDEYYKFSAEVMVNSQFIKNEYMQLIDVELLRQTLRLLLSEELSENVELECVDAFWKRRWEWANDNLRICLLDANLPFRFREGSQRVFAEQFSQNPLQFWDGKSFALIKDNQNVLIDINTDFCFEYLISQAEKAWLNTNCVLDVESAGGLIGVAKRLKDLKSENQLYLSLNVEEHTPKIPINHQVILIEELCFALKVPELLKTKLCKSLEGIKLFDEDGELKGKLNHSIIHSHRASVFISTLLSVAYLKITSNAEFKILGNETSVCCVVDCPNEARDILMSLSKNCIVFQNQLCRTNANFLNYYFTPKGARAKLFESINEIINTISSLQSSNSFEKTLIKFISNSWSLINRCGNINAPDIFVPLFQKFTQFPEDLCLKLLHGTASFGPGPVRKLKHVEDDLVECVETEYKRVLPKISYKLFDSKATDEYLSKVYSVSEVEKSLLESLDLTPKECLMYLSYGRNLRDQQHDISRIELVSVKGNSEKCAEIAAIGCFGNHGKLSCYKVMRLLYRKISSCQLKHILNSCSDDLKFEAWGREGKPIMIQGCLPFNEAENIRTKSQCDIIIVEYPIFI